MSDTRQELERVKAEWDAYREAFHAAQALIDDFWSKVYDAPWQLQEKYQQHAQRVAQMEAGR